MKVRTGILIGVTVLLHIAVFCLLIFFLLMDAITPKQYITVDQNDYGNYVGNNDNESAEEFITSFFPYKIEENFSHVKYSYRAQKGDAYAYEAYLEFSIADTAAFQSYVTKNICCAEEFPYDTNFKQHVIEDAFELTDPQERNAANKYSIDYARIGKILYCEETQQIIYIAMGVYDGSLVETDFLNVYFNRFQIDPVQYHEQYIKDSTSVDHVSLSAFQCDSCFRGKERVL